jgi:hypothetical protein
MPPLSIDVSLAQMFATLTPAQRAELIADLNARPADVDTMIAIIDESEPGSKAKWMRYGIGAAAGLVVGVIVGKAVL